MLLPRKITTIWFESLKYQEQMYYNHEKETIVSRTCFSEIWAMSTRSGVLEYLHSNNDNIERISDTTFGFNVLFK